MNAQAVEGAFLTPPVDAAHAFRAIMEAMARPGTIKSAPHVSPPAPLSSAAGACLLTLCDHETPLFLAPEYRIPSVLEWIAFHTGAPLSDKASCQFALGPWQSLLPLDDYPLGSDEYPDRSATLIVELAELSNSGASLSGPGIKDSASLSLPEVVLFQNNHARFPLGLDFLFTAGDSVAALPRSTEVS